MLVRKKDNANASEKKILLTLVRKKIMYCIIKMMKLIRKIIISFRENKYNKNINIQTKIKSTILIGRIFLIIHTEY